METTPSLYHKLCVWESGTSVCASTHTTPQEHSCWRACACAHTCVGVYIGESGQQSFLWSISF